MMSNCIFRKTGHTKYSIMLENILSSVPVFICCLKIRAYYFLLVYFFVVMTLHVHFLFLHYARKTEVYTYDGMMINCGENVVILCQFCAAITLKITLLLGNQ